MYEDQNKERLKYLDQNYSFSVSDQSLSIVLVHHFSSYERNTLLLMSVFLIVAMAIWNQP